MYIFRLCVFLPPPQTVVTIIAHIIGFGESIQFVLHLTNGCRQLLRSVLVFKQHLYMIFNYKAQKHFHYLL